MVEAGDAPTRYIFHQVKGRNSSQGPWKFSEFFGVALKESPRPSKKPVPVSDKAVLPFMLLHQRKFCASCAGIAFVTNAGIEPKLSRFLQVVAQSKSEADLPTDAKIAFEHIARAYAGVNPAIAMSSDELFLWLHCVVVYTDRGQLENSDAALLELADVVVDYSEIELLQRQAKQIAREIVAGVRDKVSHTTIVVPASDDQLRRDKGIVVADLLKTLSLSAQAYEELKTGADRDVVKQLSRLQRFCEKHGFQDQIVRICNFKAQWDVWRTIERHFLTSVDYVLLENKAQELLKQRLTIQQIVAESKAIAKDFGGATATPLGAEHVLGLVFSLAAQAEAFKLGVK